VTCRNLVVPSTIWHETWKGLRAHGDGKREAACIWGGDRSATAETARAVYFFDELPSTSGGALHHKVTASGVARILSELRRNGHVIVGDVHTHPSSWVDLSPIDQKNPVEFRLGLLAFVLPNFAQDAPDLARTGVHEYLGQKRWRRLATSEAQERVLIGELA
jgi:hypothetical protein